MWQYLWLNRQYTLGLWPRVPNIELLNVLVISWPIRSTRRIFVLLFDLGLQFLTHSSSDLCHFLGDGSIFCSYQVRWLLTISQMGAAGWVWLSEELTYWNFQSCSDPHKGRGLKVKLILIGLWCNQSHLCNTTSTRTWEHWVLGAWRSRTQGGPRRAVGSEATRNLCLFFHLTLHLSSIWEDFSD
jgi:hypothetical protein